MIIIFFILSNAAVTKNSNNLVESTYVQLIYLIDFVPSTNVYVTSPTIVTYMKAALIAGEYFTKLSKNFKSFYGDIPDHHVLKEKSSGIVHAKGEFTKQITNLVTLNTI